MSNISRSVYQKLAEENKRLKADIKKLVWVKSVEDRDLVFRKWYEYFIEEYDFHRAIKEIIYNKKPFQDKVNEMTKGRKK